MHQFYIFHIKHTALLCNCIKGVSSSIKVSKEVKEMKSKNPIEKLNICFTGAEDKMYKRRNRGKDDGTANDGVGKWLSMRSKKANSAKRRGKIHASSIQLIKLETDKTLNGEFTTAIY